MTHPVKITFSYKFHSTTITATAATTTATAAPTTTAPIAAITATI